MDYIANVENSEIDVSGIRTVLVQGDSSYPIIRFVLDPSLTGLSWRVRGTYTDTTIAVLSPEITPTESATEITLDWSVSSDFTTYDGDMQLVLVGANDTGTTIVKALAEITIQKDWSIGTMQTVTLNLFEQLMAQVNQDLSALISAHNTDAGAHATLLGAKVDKTGTGQVTPINISGVTAPANLFSTATLEQTGKYVTIDAGHIIYGTNAYLNSYIIPIADASYLFTFVRFGLLLAADRYTAIGGLIEDVTEISGVGTGAAYIAFSFTVTTYPPASYSVTKRTYTMPNWTGTPELQTAAIASAGARKPKSISVSGNIASEGYLYIPTAMNNLRKGEKIVFTGDLTSFTSMEIGLTYSPTISTGKINRVVVGAANIDVYTDGTTATTEAHGLTIASNLQVILDQTAVGTILITIISGGNSFSKEYTWTRRTIGTPYALSSGTVMVDCKLSWTCSDLDKSIWLFGDSYFGYSSERWTYYLHSLGYDENVLLDGFPGEGGVNGRNAIKYLIQYGAPRYIVWCLGMNDGTDSATPNADWVTYRDQMLALCVTHGITPVFGTIPTVPAINHEQKNAWIRASGYRYIDFAKAVGANSSGVWYAGMLDADNIHPTALGAKALNARALADIPEMMVTT